MTVQPGIRGTSSLRVTENDLAVAMRSGNVPVLATPRLVALFEEATLNALSDSLSSDETSVGMRIQIDHLAPSGLGTEIVASAFLEQVEGQRLTFNAEATTHAGSKKITLASATIVRVVVKTDAFLERTDSIKKPN
tara:strand:- start:57 stop:464 length:408 start_codon:yes stop_codon:yes gene_type:complete